MANEKPKKRRLTTPAPYATEGMVATSVRGYSMGAIRDGWLVFFNDYRTPPNDGIIDELCVVKTATDRIMLRFVKRARQPGKWDLLSVTGEPLLDQVLEWAEPVEWIRPHRMTSAEREVLGTLKTYGEMIE